MQPVATAVVRAELDFQYFIDALKVADIVVVLADTDSKINFANQFPVDMVIDTRRKDFRKVLQGLPGCIYVPGCVDKEGEKIVRDNGGLVVRIPVAFPFKLQEMLTA